MKRFKFFFVVFSVLALLLSFSAVDVKAGLAPGEVDDCVLACEDTCHSAYEDARDACVAAQGGRVRGECIGDALINKAECATACVDACNGA